MSSAKNIARFCLTFVLFIVAFYALVYSFTDFMMVVHSADWLETSFARAHETGFLSYAVSIALVCFLSALLAALPFSVSMVFLGLLYVVVIMPIIILYGWGGRDLTYMLACVGSFLIVFGIVVWPHKDELHTKTKQFFSIKTKIFVPLTILSAMLVILVSLANGGGATINFDINRVYEFRRAAGDTLPSVLSYVLTNLTAALLPLSIAYTLWKKRYVQLSVLLLITFTLYILFSHKSYLFVPIISMGGYFLFSRKASLNLILIGTTLVALVAVFLASFGGVGESFGLLTVRRMIFAPAYIDYIYHDFFSQNPFVYWADSKLSLGLIESSYGVPTPQIIANEYTGVDFTDRVDRFANINTGWLGAGFAQLGYFGIVIYAIIIGLLIRFTDKLSNKTSATLAGGGSIYAYLLLFGTSDVPTSLLSHGLLILVFMAIFIKKEDVITPGKAL